MHLVIKQVDKNLVWQRISILLIDPYIEKPDAWRHKVAADNRRGITVVMPFYCIAIMHFRIDSTHRITIANYKAV